MRKVIDMQMRIGEVAVDNITFDPRSRDEILELLMGLKSIYCNRESLFNNISWWSCLKIKQKNGETSYYHQVVAATIVCPGIRQIIPLAPELIQNIDGSTKQDCEINAGKQIINKMHSSRISDSVDFGLDMKKKKWYWRLKNEKSLIKDYFAIKYRRILFTTQPT